MKDLVLLAACCVNQCVVLHLLLTWLQLMLNLCPQVASVDLTTTIMTCHLSSLRSLSTPFGQGYLHLKPVGTGAYHKLHPLQDLQSAVLGGRAAMGQELRRRSLSKLGHTVGHAGTTTVHVSKP